MKKYSKPILIFIISPIIIVSSLVDTPLSDLNQAEKFFLLGKFRQSIIAYQDQIRKSENEEIPSYNIGYIYYLESKFDSASHYCNQSLKYNPQYGPALYLKGLLNKENGNLHLWGKYLKESLDSHPDKEFPFFELGKFYLKQSNYAEAENYFRESIHASDIFSIPYPYLAWALEKQGRNKEAIKVLENGLETSYDAKILERLIPLYKKTDQDKKAQKYSGLFVYLFPEHPFSSQLSKNNPDNSSAMGFKELPVREKDSNVFFPVGEEKLYRVSIGPLKVGELFTAIQDTLIFNGKKVYQVRFSLDSNPDLAFAAVLHSDYLSYVDMYSKQVELHYLHTRENEKIWDKVYDFDRNKHKFVCRTVREDGHIDVIEKYLPRNTIDGTSILFYSRQIVKEKRSERVMTIIDENFVISDINYTGKMEPVEVRGQEENCYLISGTNHYKGIVGFTGDFRGWFRNSPDHLPVQSDFKIWVGRIKVTTASEEEQKLHKYSK